jgi:hypothetical protein
LSYLLSFSVLGMFWYRHNHRCIVVYAWASFGTLIVARKSGSLSDEMTPEAYARSRRRGFFSALFISVVFALYFGMLFLP